jgi:5-methylcytosine-specific restriction endonuclease McrA
VRAMSNKRRRQLGELQAARVVVLERDEHMCQMDRFMDGHHHYGPMHVHHIKRRSQGGGNEPSNLICLCQAAHDYVHNNPREAALLGLLILNKGD